MKHTQYYIYSWPRRFNVIPKDMSKTVCGFNGFGDAVDYATAIFRGVDSSIFWCVAPRDDVAVRIMDQMVEYEFYRTKACLFDTKKDVWRNIIRMDILKTFKNKEDGDFK